MKNEDIQGQDHAREGGGHLLHLDTDGQEADQGEGPIQNREAGGDLKVQGEEGLIPEKEAEDPGAHPKPGIKRKKRKRRNVLKLLPRATAQLDDLEAQAEKEDVEEAGVEHGHLKNPDLLKGKCPGPHPHEGIKRKKRRIKTKREVEMRGNDQPARKKKAKTKRRIENENPKVIKM